MMTVRKLDENMAVSGQVMPDDVESLKASGIRMIINNRPDGEEPGQPPASEVEAAARAAGLGYRYIPFHGLSAEQIEEMAAALDDADGPVLAFCKSGTRSAYLWALARSRQGEQAAILEEKAAAAGYDLTPILRFL